MHPPAGRRMRRPGDGACAAPCKREGGGIIPRVLEIDRSRYEAFAEVFSGRITTRAFDPAQVSRASTSS